MRMLNPEPCTDSPSLQSGLPGGHCARSATAACCGQHSAEAIRGARSDVLEGTDLVPGRSSPCSDVDSEQAASYAAMARWYSCAPAATSPASCVRSASATCMCGGAGPLQAWTACRLLRCHHRSTIRPASRSCEAGPMVRPVRYCSFGEQLAPRVLVPSAGCRRLATTRILAAGLCSLQPDLTWQCSFVVLSQPRGPCHCQRPVLHTSASARLLCVMASCSAASAISYASQAAPSS